MALIIVVVPIVSYYETYTYEEATERFAEGKFVTVDARKVHYLEKGNGEPIILIHGYDYHTVMWKKHIDALAEKFKVYAIDLWGFGYSERIEPPAYSFELYGKQVTGFMDALSIKKATLVGQSYGGGISVYVAAHYPERVEQLILIGPGVIPFPPMTVVKIAMIPFFGEFIWAIRWDFQMKNMIRTMRFYDESKVTEDYLQEVMQPARIKGSSSAALYILRHVIQPPWVEKEANLLAEMETPILIIHGREDMTIPLDTSEALNDLWKGSELVIFEKARHNAHEEHPEKFNKLVIDFLSDKSE